MSQPSETSGLPLDLALDQQQPNTNTIHQPTSTHTKHRKSSDSPRQPKKTAKPRRCSGATEEASSGPHAGSSRSEQRSSTSPANMSSHSSSVHYTRTGRISKAKKGLKVHDCENCGRSYTRAEHLRRHQKNHAKDGALFCDYPDCDKVFFRADLLQRHQERHNEPGHTSRQPSVCTPEGSPELPQVSMSEMATSSVENAMTLPTTASYYPIVPSMPESTELSRYTSTMFRTPQIPRTPQFPLSNLNHVVRSSPSTTSPNQKQRRSFTGRHTGAVPVPIDAMTPGLGWNESYGSPNYSVSSGYASPLPEYPTVYPHSPYVQDQFRTRASSTASYNEPWSYASRSPASTMGYAWPPNDKTPTFSDIAYMGTSYPMASLPIMAGIDPITGYEHYCSKSMVQRDEEEGKYLFGEQQYGMGSITHTYPFEQYLDYFWRLFHPTFPVVHRHAFELVDKSPLLHAAMIALGGQHSNDTSVKRKSRELHDRCIKLLRKRDHEIMSEPERLCDYQALFLIEVFSQYRARRSAKVLSSRFVKVYNKSAEDFRNITCRIADLASPIKRSEITQDRWSEWVELATWQRLLVACYVLESQQGLFLARESVPSLIQEIGLDLPLPAHLAIWDVKSPAEWATASQQYSTPLKYVYQVELTSMMVPLDAFQSSLLLSAHYNRANTSIPYASLLPHFDLEPLLDTSPATTRQLLTAKLMHVTPIRALLAVSGESWVFSEKVSEQSFPGMKATLRTWIAQLWLPCAPGSHTSPIVQAMKLSIMILEAALKEQRDSLALEMGTDVGIYFAALVLWAATTAATTRRKHLQQSPRRRHSQSPALPSASDSDPALYHPPHSSLASSVVTISPPSSPLSQSAHDNTRLLSHAQITINTISFLSHALVDFDNAFVRITTPGDIALCHKGCISLLLWVKLRLRGVSLDDGVESERAGRANEKLGELLEGITGVLEKMLEKVWSGWGI